MKTRKLKKRRTRKRKQTQLAKSNRMSPNSPDNPFSMFHKMIPESSDMSDSPSPSPIFPTMVNSSPESSDSPSPSLMFPTMVNSSPESSDFLDLTSESDVNELNSSPEEDFFIHLGQTHIIQNKLEWVKSKTWLQQKGCNIFIIGERHNPRNYKCNGIYEMFMDLTTEFNKSVIKPKIDIMLEITEHDVKNWKYTTELQINLVRDMFIGCINDKSCQVNVHWTDVSLMTTGKGAKWINDLTLSYYVDVKSTIDYKNWTHNHEITNELKKPEDLLKLITHNAVLMKEIKKAQKINPKFNVEFVKDYMNKKIIYGTNVSLNKDFYTTVFHAFRTVMDFYTVARIIKFEMKNVIIYVGQLHAIRIIEILEELNFTTIEIATNLKCLD